MRTVERCVSGLSDKKSTDREVKLSTGSQRSASLGGRLSDEEPLYDSVCSDEDYASIGDNQSVSDECANVKPVKVASKESIETPVSDIRFPLVVVIALFSVGGDCLIDATIYNCNQ